MYGLEQILLDKHLLYRKLNIKKTRCVSYGNINKEKHVDDNKYVFLYCKVGTSQQNYGCMTISVFLI